MAKVFEVIDERLREFIEAQPVFFVATAPETGGHVNVSPKGYADTFAVLGERTVAYLDLYGSGAETIAHLRENGRITVMFCSFARQPKILRLYGQGRVVRPDDAEWTGLIGHFGAGHAGIRAIMVVDVERIADSCGFAVPNMELAGERPLLEDNHRHRTEETWPAVLKRNLESIDGLPALDPDHPAPGQAAPDQPAAGQSGTR